MQAPRRFAEWTSQHTANDKKHGRKVYRYHPRSDAHSQKICELILDDLVEASSKLRVDLTAGRVSGGINVRHTFVNGKQKALDLALVTGAGDDQRLLLSCEAKQCMTEHGKTKPRIFDELSSSHEIVHQGDRFAIACGVVVVNIADRFASPLRQANGSDTLVFTAHRQPAVCQSMVEHLRGLVVRDSPEGIGFDAFATIVIDCDNVGPCALWTDPPAPQPGDVDHYGTFVNRIVEAYESRFGGS